MDKNLKSGFIFTPYQAPEQSHFEKLFEIFSDLITHTSGDVEEALDWFKILDKEYKLTSEEYTFDDFLEDLKKKGYLREEIKANGAPALKITPKTERALRKNAMEQLFGNIKKSGIGSHKSKKSGQGDEATGEFRNFQFGDSIEQISITESLKNAQINHGIGEFKLAEEDLIIEDTHHKSQKSSDGACGTNYNALSQRYFGCNCFWKRCLASTN